MSRGKQSDTRTTTPRSGRPTHGSGAPETLSAEELTHLQRLEHYDPHTVLGAHRVPDGVVLRTLRPDAARVFALPEGEAPVELPRREGTDLFEQVLAGREKVPAYRLELHRHDGTVVTLHDPYAFWPTLGELDLHLIREGQHDHIYNKLGAHPCEVAGVEGVSFAVWAPNARGISVVGDFNGWDGRCHPMRALGGTGVWELFVPELGEGERYKYEVRGADGRMVLKADPYATRTEMPPANASVIYRSRYSFNDEAWREAQRKRDFINGPMSVYEVHAGSWRHVPGQPGRSLSYRELAEELADYVSDMGFTHVEFMPLNEHPFYGSWGYQVGSFYAPTARFGDPDELRYMVDRLHQRGIGVLIDWVPAHFPKDEFSLGRFDGTALYEHLDPRQGEHPDWGTYVFNYARPEVRNFLVGSAQYWLREYHMDGLRMDAVASMIYLNYSRNEGEWVPNRYGSNENLEAISLLKELNEKAHAEHPGTLMIAEESTAWPGVSRPTYVGGLGFGFKWNMGWMHDTLGYFSRDPIYRRYHHNNLTFGLVYAWSENFMLPLSHDEVVHGKGSLINKMPGDRWQKFANLRAMYGHMWAHPGKQLLFMGGEIGQWAEWNHNAELDWHLLHEPDHRGLQSLVRDLNRVYLREPALWACDNEPQGFQWIDGGNAEGNIIAYLRIDPHSGRRLVVVGNFSPAVHYGYRIGVPEPGYYRELLNTDAAHYGGSDVGNAGGVTATREPMHGQPCSASLTLPPLACVWLEVP